MNCGQRVRQQSGIRLRKQIPAQNPLLRMEGSPSFDVKGDKATASEGEHFISVAERYSEGVCSCSSRLTHQPLDLFSKRHFASAPLALFTSLHDEAPSPTDFWLPRPNAANHRRPDPAGPICWP